jgi:uncharacterized protein YoxC
VTVLWIALGVIALAGAFVVIRALAKVAAAAKDLQRNVIMLNKHVTSAIQNMGADVQALNESVDDLRRDSTDTVPEGAGAGPERSEGT